MTGKLLITLVVLSTLAGCARVSESRLNPLNWFGRSERVATVTVDPATGAAQVNMVSQITQLRAEQVPGGAILRATGLPPRQGFYGGELVYVGAEDGVLNYQFAIAPPPEQTRVSTTQSREIVVGLYLSNQTLAGVRQIRVSSASNALAIRR